VFDCGLTLVEDDPIADENLSFYAPNLWPDMPEVLPRVYRNITCKALILN
jgi:hypothetical protein